jgi:hypothetical protein
MYIQKKINDIDVVAYRMPYVSSVYIGIWLKVGSRHEKKNKMVYLILSSTWCLKAQKEEVLKT